MTKRIIIRIIIAVSIAFILSKFKLLGIMQVNAKTASTSFSYSNQLITNSSIDFNFTTPFATDMDRGTLITNVTISTNILYTNSKKPILRQATVFNGTSTNVCKIGSVSSGGVFSQNSGGIYNTFDYDSQTYTLECEVTPNPNINKITLYFSGNTNYSYLSFGPTVSFRENDLLLEMKKQSETCVDSPNLLNNSSSNSSANGLTITKNNDNSITINGTATATTYYNINSSATTNLENGKIYTLSTQTTLPTGVRLSLRKYSVAQDLASITANSNKVTFTSNFSGSTFAYLTINNGTILNNLTIYPQLEEGSIVSSYSPYGIEQCKNKQDLALEESQKQTQAQNETNAFLKDEDSSQAETKAEAFFEDFDSSDYGLKDVVLSPLTFIESLLDFQCSPLLIPLPFVSENVVLPCMSNIYSQFPTFYSLWQMITTGMVCYYVCINIFGRVKQLTDPMNDKIEVIQL